MKLAPDALLTPTPATVAMAVERIAAACQPMAILVFGSRAQGRARPESDLDLFVLLSHPAPDRSALQCHLRGLLADLPFAKDVIVNDEVTFSQRQKRRNSVYRDIAERSLPIWYDGRIDVAAIEEVCR